MTKKNPAIAHDVTTAAPLPRLRLNREVIAALQVRSDVRTGIGTQVGVIVRTSNNCCPQTSLQ